MSLESVASDVDGPLFYVKEQSGRRIEEARKREGLTQRELAQQLRMGVRWLREIESGNPKARLDDHLLCAYRLGLSTGHILIPLMFFAQKMAFPRQLAIGDLRELERLCIEVVAQKNIEQLTNALTPRWRHGPPLPSAA
ncbi:transcriptional regulator with XRE-family HTH domain [Sphingobium sp. B2D3A]|uniref:helix-turn-helix domain-containing protein n=1 Tax=unclassified Sphingobium TaxID=2611147 RepID=UPI002224CC5C|nr:MULTISPECIES: helix-turn-helix domain-containing protein [unclassified Sphingobium]MCW2338187.1 transcriptional regulator with XRE-family HTH domain [Sphingobium sp. B2D3A]MCW2384646.1 transcriptional regulator with XRE-family HTH domain [Sphingobium sp. B2D3D]